MQLFNIQNRLVIVVGENRYSFPFSYSFEGGIVKIWSIDDSTIEFKKPISEILDSLGNPYVDITDLETFLLPLAGFNTASGGSEVGEGVFETENGIAVSATATGSGTAIKAVRSSGIAAQFVGKQLIEQEDSGSNNDSSILEVNSTVLGSLPAPRMTTLQKDAIPFPATGLMVYDLNRVRYETYDGIRWVGMRRIIMGIQHGGGWTAASNGTFAFSCFPTVPNAASISPPPFLMRLTGSGVITGCYLNSWASGTAGSNQSWSLFIRLNNVDYLVATLSTSNSIRIFENYNLNIPYVDGDTYRMIYVTNNFTQNPTSVAAAGFLIAQ